MTALHFISGLPRSGSTLLCNVLAQNPRFRVTGTSGLLDVLYGIREHWGQIVELQASPNDGAKRRVLRAALLAFHADAEANQVIFDKSRGWTSEIELLEELLGRRVKIVVPVRDIRDVLASFEKIWRRNFLIRKYTDRDTYLQCQTVEGRCHYWLRNDQPLGIAYNRIIDAMHRGFKDRLHFVHFERFTANPAQELGALYQFLGEEPFAHNFEHVEQVTLEDDTVYGLGDLHTIQSKISSSTSQWPTVLGAFAEQFGTLNF